MSSLASINIKFRADLKQFSTEMQSVMRDMESQGKKLANVGKNLSIGITAPIAALGTLAVINFDTQAKAIAQVEAGIKSTGGAAGLTSEELQKMASELQNISTFGDEAILKDVTAQLLTFSNVTGDTFGRAQQAILDLATRLDGDLKGSAIQVGKALNDPIKGVTALSKAGVSFTEEQKATIKSLVEANKLYEAQTIVLSELERQYGGSAEAAAKVGLGPFTQLKNILGDITEDFGKIISEALQPFIAKMKELATRFQSLSPETKKFIAIAAGIAAAVGPLLVAIGGIAAIIPTVISGFAAMGGALAVLTGPIGLVAAGLAAVAYVVYENWAEISKAFKQVKQYFIDLYNQSLVFRGGIQLMIFSLKTLWDAVKLVVASIVDYFKLMARQIVEVFSTIGNLVKAVLTGNFKEIPGILAGAFKQFVDNGKKFGNDLASNGKKFGKSFSENFKTGIQSTFGGEKITLPADAVNTKPMKESIVNSVVDGIVEGAKKAGERLKVAAVSALTGAIVSTGGVGTISDYENQITFWKTYRTEVANTTAEIQRADEKIRNLETAIQVLEKGPASLIQMKDLTAELNAEVAKLGITTQETFSEIDQQITDLLENGIENLIGGIAEGIGRAFSGESFNFGELLFSSLGNMMIELGKIAIQTGLAIETIKAALKSLGGLGAIAAGVALIALGSAVKSKVSGLQKFQDGGIVGGSSFYGDKILARVNSGELIMNGKQQRALWGMMQGAGSTVMIEQKDILIEGDKLRIVLDRADKKKSRTS